VNKPINLFYFILFLHVYFLFLCNLNKIQWNKFESIFLFWFWRQWIKTIHSYLFFYLYIDTSLFFYFFILFFWAGPSSAHMGWARPSQPGPVTGPSQWPGWAKKLKARVKWIHACMNTAWSKLLSHSVLVTIQFEMKMQKGMKKRAYLLLETEDACSADDDSRLLLPFVFLLFSLVCIFLLFSQ